MLLCNINCSHTVTRKALPLGWSWNTRMHFSAIRLPTAADGHHIAYCARRPKGNPYDYKNHRMRTRSPTQKRFNYYFSPFVIRQVPTQQTWIRNTILYIIWFWLHHSRPKKNKIYVRNVLHFSQIQNRKLFSDIIIAFKWLCSMRQCAVICI